MNAFLWTAWNVMRGLLADGTVVALTWIFVPLLVFCAIVGGVVRLVAWLVERSKERRRDREQLGIGGRRVRR